MITKPLAVVIAIFSTFTLTNNIAEAVSCPEYADVQDQVIKITPPNECLRAKIRRICLERSVKIDFYNDCDDEGKVVGEEFEGDFAVSSPRDKRRVVSGTPQDLTYTVTTGDIAHEVNIAFTPVYIVDDGCSVTGTKPANFFLLAGFVFMFVRRKNK